MHLLLFSEPDSVFIFLNLKYNTVSNRSFCFHISLDLIKTFFNTYFLMVSHVFRCHTSCFLGGSVVKNSPANAGDARDVSLIPGSGRPPGVGNGNLLQYSCLENSMDRGAREATVHGVAKSWTRLSDWGHTHTHTPTYRHTHTRILKIRSVFYLSLSHHPSPP